MNFIPKDKILYTCFSLFLCYTIVLMLAKVKSMAVIGLLTGKIIALAVIGGVFVIEVGSSLIQLLGKKFLGRKILPAAPFHLFLQQKGWEEPKIVMRLWIISILFVVFGLMIAFDLPSKGMRDNLIIECLKNGLVLLGCGERTIRVIPPYIISEKEADEGIDIIEKSILKISNSNFKHKGKICNYLTCGEGVS